MNCEFGRIERLIEDLGAIDRAAPLMASLSWSFAMSVGQITARLLRYGDEDAGGTEGNKPSDDRADEIRRLENRRDELGELLGWAVRQSNPDYVPSASDVVSRIQDGQVQPAAMSEEVTAMLCEELGVSKRELAEARQRNEEYAREEAIKQAAVARAYENEIVAAVNAYLASGPQIVDQLNQVDAIRITDRIAQKSADYAERVLGGALRQRRQRRRDERLAEYRLLRDIESRAEDLLDQLNHERDAAASDQELEPQRA